MLRSLSRLSDKEIKIELYINFIKAVSKEACITNDKGNVTIIVKNLNLYKNVDVSFTFRY